MREVLPSRLILARANQMQTFIDSSDLFIIEQVLISVDSVFLLDNFEPWK